MSNTAPHEKVLKDGRGQAFPVRAVDAPADVLRFATRKHHARVDSLAAMRQLCAAGLSLPAYAHTQARFYRIYAPLERSLDSDGWTKIDIEPLARRSALRLDLGALAEPVSLASECSVAPCPSEWAWLGRAYVLEGSQLGATVIRNSLERLEWFDGNHCGRFFQRASPQRWHNFRQALNHSLTDENYLLEAVAEAQRTFSCITDWMING